jgi:hypothetical protein
MKVKRKHTNIIFSSFRLNYLKLLLLFLSLERYIKQSAPQDFMWTPESKAFLKSSGNNSLWPFSFAYPSNASEPYPA